MLQLILLQSMSRMGVNWEINGLFALAGIPRMMILAHQLHCRVFCLKSMSEDMDAATSH